MKIELITPLKKPAQIRVTYNDKELFTKDFAAGETPKLEFDTPQETGVAKAFLLIDGKEIPLGSATYNFDGQPDNHPNDHDGDGVPDRGPRDQDGDGLPDRGTAEDDDGDGIPDRDSGDLPV